MNRIKLLFFIITPLAMLLQSNTVLAEEPPKALYCPQKIVCSKTKSIRSCKAIGEHVEYWGEMFSSGTVQKGTYLFLWAHSSYQAPNMVTTSCSYSYINFPYTKISIKNRIEYNKNLVLWEALQNDATNWYRAGGYQARCFVGSRIAPKTCPLKSVPLIKVISPAQWSISKFSAYANGILITPEPIYPPIGIINIYQAWDACSDTGICIINLMATINQALVEVGSIVVDMENKMKIVDTHATTEFEIYHDEKSNSIGVKDKLYSEVNGSELYTHRQ